MRNRAAASNVMTALYLEVTKIVKFGEDFEILFIGLIWFLVLVDVLGNHRNN